MWKLILVWLAVSASSDVSQDGLHLVTPPSRQQMLLQSNLTSERPEEHTARAMSKGFLDLFRRQPPRWGPMTIPYPGPGVLRPHPMSPHTNPLPHLTLAPPTHRNKDRMGIHTNGSPNKFESGFMPAKRVSVSAPSALVNTSRVELVAPRALCDFYTDSLCIDSHPYPYGEMQRSFPMELPALRRIIADVEQLNAEILTDGVTVQDEAQYTFEHYYGNDGNNSHSYKDYGADGGFLCPSDIKYVRPKRARNPRGQWKTIVNLGDHGLTQTIRIEKCLKPFSRCSYVFSYLRSECVQLYNFQRLASWDEKRGFHLDIYKIPVSCVCHLRSSSNLRPTTPAIPQAAPNNQSHKIQQHQIQQLLQRPTAVKPSRVLSNDRAPNFRHRVHSHKQHATWIGSGSDNKHQLPSSNRFQPQIGHRQSEVASSSAMDRVNFETNPVSVYMHTWGR